MKYMILSDLHGSAFWCRRALDAFREEGAERLLLLGDLLYHGPRNDLPGEYAPKQVIPLLNDLSDRIFCVRGNCDTEVDQAVLGFPLLADYALLKVNGRVLFATHGHRWNASRLPSLQPGDVLLHGHTHVPSWEEKDGIYVLNPGSVSLPKCGSCHGYMTLEDGLFLWKDLETRMETHRLFLPGDRKLLSPSSSS